jgi:O-antigen/teichoic acid export membrane protein
MFMFFRTFREDRSPAPVGATSVAPTNGLFHSVFKNSGWALGGQAIAAPLLFLETLLLARLLPIEVLGNFVIIVSAADFVFGILDFRTGEAVVRFFPELRKSGRESALLRLLFIIDSFVALGGLVVVSAGGALFLRRLGLPSQYFRLLIIVACGLALQSIVRSVGSYLRVAGFFQLSIKLGIVYSCSRLLCMVIALMVGGEISHLCWAVAAADTLFFVLMLSAAIITFRSLDVHPLATKVPLEQPERKLIRAFLLGTNVTSTLRILATRLDIILIAALSSARVVALYRVATRIAGTLLLVSDPLLLAVYPEMAKLHAAKADSDLRRLVSTLTKGLAVLTALGFIIFAVFGKHILGTLAGPQYVAAHPVALVMLVGTSLAMIFFWARPLLLIYDKTRQTVNAAVIGTVLQFVCLYILVPVLGAEAAAAAFTLNYLVTIVLFVVLLRKPAHGLFPKKLSLRELLP